jgi:two-component system, OmpR family, sensor histidine kinase KdpD
MTKHLDADRLTVLVHEVRSPVAALSAIAETLANGDLDSASRRELVRLVTLACRGIERVVADATVASIHPERIDPLDLVQDVVAAANLRGANVALTLPATTPVIDADPARLRQALDNLVTNAVVHGGAGNGVEVSVRDEDALLIEVSDRGIGIAAGELERIFDVGVRLDPESRGAGLGLALARAIVEGHGGVLTVVSSPGVGTTFTISLPRPAQPATRA